MIYMKKNLKIFGAAILSIALFACSNGNTTTTTQTTTNETTENTTENTSEESNSEEIVTVKYVGPGTASEYLPRVLEKVNAKLQSDGLNIQFDPTFVAWDAWDQKINMMLSTGEEFDLLHIMENSVPTGSFVGRGALMPIDEYLTEVPELKTKFQDYEWEAVSVNGEIYSIPNRWGNPFDMNGETGGIGIRTDVLDKLGMDLPTNAEEMMDSLLAQKEYWGNSNIYAWDHEINRTPVWLHRTYDTWPFYVEFNDSLIYVSQEGEVKSWLETEEFKQDSDYYRELYTNGLINPDILSLPTEERSKAGNNGDFLAGFGTFNLDSQAGYINKGLDITIADFVLAPEEPAYIFMPVLNCNAIPVTSKHPKEALEFLNWVFDSQENMCLLNLGEEGIDYTAIGEDRYEYIVDEANPASSSPRFPSWQIGYLPSMRLDASQTDEYVERLRNTSDNYEISIVSGFAFDKTPVQAEYANCVAQLATTIFPIKYGILDYDEAFPAAIEKMKTAGLDKVVAEYEKQFKEFLANK